MTPKLGSCDIFPNDSECRAFVQGLEDMRAFADQRRPFRGLTPKTAAELLEPSEVQKMAGYLAGPGTFAEDEYNRLLDLAKNGLGKRCKHCPVRALFEETK